MRQLHFVLITMAFITFIVEPHFSPANHITKIPYIGKVRKIFDSDGKETKYFIPIAKDDFTKNRIANAQLLRLGKITQYLNWLGTEQDPDVRRHYLFEIGNSSTEEAKWVINKLLPMLEKEPVENVRIAYISCLSSLATNAGLNDDDILKILNTIRITIETDSSWNVKVHAANILSWYGGGDEGITVIREVIDKNIQVIPDVMYCVPSTLQRIGGDTAKELLNEIKSYSKDENLKIDSGWRLYQLGLASKEETLSTVEGVAKNSKDEKARMRAISILGAIAKDNPEIKSTIKSIADIETNETVRRFLGQLLKSLEHR